MAKAHYIQTAFNAGEWSPRMEGRCDHEKYKFALRKCENFIPYAHGGAHSRAGFRYIAETKTSAQRSRLIPFIYSDTQAYHLEFGNLYTRFYKDKAPILSGGTPYELTTTYTWDDLEFLQYAQSADVLYLACPNKAPRKITRLGDTSWTFFPAASVFASGVIYYEGPYRTQNTDMSYQLVFSATSGNIQVGCGPSLFQPGHVGSTWRVKHPGKSLYSEHSSISVSTPIKFRGKFMVNTTAGAYYKGRVVLQTSPAWGGPWTDVASFTTSTKQEFTESCPTGMWYRLDGREYTAASSDKSYDTVIMKINLYQDEHWGSFYITQYISPTLVNAFVVYELGDTTASPWWCEGAWSDYRGYPQSVGFWDGRLCFAGSTSSPYTIWRSWVNDFENFTPCDSATDEGADSWTLSEIDNKIQWVRKPAAGVVVGTIGETATISPTKTGVVAASNPPDVKVQDGIGSAAGMPPLKVGSSLVFLSRSRRKLINLAYSLDDDALASVDLSLFAEHITAGGLGEIAYQPEPDSVIWGARNDGVLVACSYYRSEKVIGWSRHITDGLVESVSVIPSNLGTAEGADELWCIVKRYINGTWKRYVEVMENNESAEQNDFFCVDCGLSYDGVPITTVQGLGHLEGKYVTGIADGYVIPLTQVVSGQIVLDTAASTIIVGLPYTCTLQTMRLEVSMPDGTAQGRVKKVIRATLRLVNSWAGKMGTKAGKERPIPMKNYNQTILNQAPFQVLVGDIPIDNPGDPDSDGCLVIVQDQPLPMTILALMQHVNIGD